MKTKSEKFPRKKLLLLSGTGSAELTPKALEDYLVPIHKWLFSPISLLDRNFNPRNIAHMPAVKISVRIEIDENISFMDGHYLAKGRYLQSACISDLLTRLAALPGVTLGRIHVAVKKLMPGYSCKQH